MIAQNQPILVGTHHKTGTVWMLSVFRQICATFDIPMCELSRAAQIDPAKVFFSENSSFSAGIMASDFRGLHLIRDPRDVLISALRYHKDSTEPWLHLPEDRFGGMTYQEKLSSLAPDAQFEFEMLNATKHTVGEMLAWNYADRRFFEARYEELIDDRDGLQFEAISRFLGFDVLDSLRAGAIFRKKSLFEKRIPENHPHVRSGAKEQWKSGFGRSLGKLFAEILGDSLIELGYEPDHSWIDHLISD